MASHRSLAALRLDSRERGDRRRELLDVLPRPGLIGLFLGVVITVGISWLAGWTVSIGVGTVAIGMFASAAVGIIFGCVPSRRAARLNPIDALRYE